MMIQSHIVDDLYFEIPDSLAKIYTRFEPLSTKVVCEQLKAGDAFLDIGANFGYFSLLAAHTVGPGGQVIAVEASPEVLPQLRKNLQKFEHAEVIHAAVGKEKGTTEFFLTDDFVNSGVSQSPFLKQARKISVAMDTIDNLLAARGPGKDSVQFIKCDVQGDEMAVLEGARQSILKADRLKLIIEWAPAWMSKAGFEPEEFPAFLKSLGFASLTVVDDYLQKTMSIEEMEAEFREDTSGRRFCNVLAEK